MRTSIGGWLRRLTSDESELEADNLCSETDASGATRAGHCSAGQRAQIMGKLRAVQLQPCDPLASLVADHHTLLATSPIPRPRVVEINDRFHDALVAAAGNHRLAELVGANRTYYFNFRLAAHYTDDQTIKALQDHVTIAQAVLAGDGSRADQLAREHVDFAMTLIEQYGDYRR